MERTEVYSVPCRAARAILVEEDDEEDSDACRSRLETRRRPSMRVQRVPTRPKIPLERQSDAEPGQQGPLLLLARIACIVVVALALGLFVVTFPVYFAHLHQIRTTAFCSFGQSTVSGVGQL